MKKIAYAVALLLVLALFVGTAVFLYNKSQQAPVVFETAKPFYTDIVKKTVAIGKIVPRKEVFIKSQVSGVVENLFVQPGEKVKKGDLIARIQLIPDMEHLNNAESQLQRARISLRNAERELERQRKLFQDNLIPESEFNKFMLDYDLQEEAVQSAENNVQLIKEGVSRESGKVSNLVRATVDGMVLDVPVEEGVFVIETNTFNEGTTIAAVADMGDMIFEGQVDESEVGKIREGMELVLKVGALDDEPFTATLEYISPKGVEDQGTIKFEIRAAVRLDQGRFLRAGYSANADIVLARKEDVLAINEGNLLFGEQGETYVEVEVAPQSFEKRAVETGISDGINVEIVSGIDQDAQIKKI